MKIGLFDHVEHGKRPLATLFDGGMPHIGHAGLKELVVDLPTPQSGAESRMRFRLADANLDLANFRERTPTKFSLAINRLFVDLVARGATGIAAPLLALGYRDIDLSASVAGALIVNVLLFVLKFPDSVTVVFSP